MTTLAIILARAGSKGLPGKNSRPIAGKPCVAWTIEHALATPAVERVIVSSDDNDVRAIAAEYRVESFDRPDDLASDSATIDDAARHALAQIADPAIERIAILYANVPVRPDDLTGRAFSTLAQAGADSVQSFAPVGKHHPLWTAVVDEASGDVRPWQGDTLNANIFRRQDLPPAHIPDGGVIALTRAALQLDIPGVPPGPHAFLGADRRGIMTAEGSVIDIDSEIDAIVADTILRQRIGAPA